MRIVRGLQRRLIRFSYRAARPVRERIRPKELHIACVREATPLVRDLFLQCFGEMPPLEPVHYVALHGLGHATFGVLGYLHVQPRPRYGLVGGLCVDDRYRGLGVGEALVARALRAADHPTYFAHVVNPASIAIARRLGFEATRHEALFVRWSNHLSQSERNELVAEVAAIGIF